MRPHRAFALLAALLPTPALLAQDIPAPAAAMAPWIQVELIVFRNLDTSTAGDEQWPAKPALGYPEPLHFLREAAPAAPPGSAPTGATPAASGTLPPLAFARLPREQSLLRDAAARIGNSPNYRLLAQLAWRQPAPAAGTTEHVVVTGGTAHGEHRELEGYVSLSRTNFTHVATHLWLNDFDYPAAGGSGTSGTGAEGVTLPPVPQPPVAAAADPFAPAALPLEASAGAAPGAAAPERMAAEGAPPGITVEPARATRSVLLSASRRVAPGEVHYIDHPLFGAILKIEPWDPDAASSPGADAPDGAAQPGAAPQASR
jgi:Peptidoglycan-binding protein, CsiV